MSSSSSTITCILPVHNGEAYLAEAIDSVLAQTVPVAELIVVDDGSTDRTAEVARGYGKRIRYVAQPKAGTPAARDRGLRLAGGDFIVFIDADDVFHPDKNERQLGVFCDLPKTELCICAGQNFWSPELDPSAAPPEADLQPRRSRGQPVSWMARTDLFERLGGFVDRSERAALEGPRWYLRAVEAGVCVAEVDDCLFQRRLHLTNKSRQPDKVDAMLSLMQARARAHRSELA